jgi:hypothetical protein
MMVLFVLRRWGILINGVKLCSFLFLFFDIFFLFVWRARVFFFFCVCVWSFLFSFYVGSRGAGEMCTV